MVLRFVGIVTVVWFCAAGPWTGARGRVIVSMGGSKYFGDDGSKMYSSVTRPGAVGEWEQYWQPGLAYGGTKDDSSSSFCISARSCSSDSWCVYPCSCFPDLADSLDCPYPYPMVNTTVWSPMWPEAMSGEYDNVTFVVLRGNPDALNSTYFGGVYIVQMTATDRTLGVNTKRVFPDSGHNCDLSTLLSVPIVQQFSDSTIHWVVVCQGILYWYEMSTEAGSSFYPNSTVPLLAHPTSLLPSRFLTEFPSILAVGATWVQWFSPEYSSYPYNVTVTEGELIFAASHLDTASVITCSSKDGKVFIKLHFCDGKNFNWVSQTLYSWDESTEVCALTVDDLQESVPLDDMIICMTSNWLHWLVRDESYDWQVYNESFPSSHPSLTIIASKDQQTSTYSLLLADNYTFSEIYLEFSSCTDFTDSSHCVSQGCSWCLNVCLDECPDCSSYSDSDSCQLDHCVWCDQTLSCQQYCTVCSALEVGTCSVSGCMWSDELSTCMALEDWCYSCSGTKCEYPCLTCNSDICSAIQCQNCSNITEETHCLKNANLCTWCSSLQQCQSNSAFSSYACDCSHDSTCSSSGCFLNTTVKQCLSRCLNHSAYSKASFFSTYIQSAHYSETTDIVFDDDGNSYILHREGDAPLLLKVNPSGEVIQSPKTFDRTGYGKALALDPATRLLYVVGSGQNVPLLTENAPQGLLQSIVPSTVDAAILAYDIDVMNIVWSVRWGGQSSTEEFMDIVVIANKYRILAGNVPCDFQILWGSCANSCGTSMSGLILIFDNSNDWNMLHCEYTPSYLQFRSSPHLSYTLATSDTVAVTLNSLSAKDNDGSLSVAALGTVQTSNDIDCLVLLISSADGYNFVSHYTIFGSDQIDSCSKIWVEKDIAYISGSGYAGFAGMQNGKSVSKFPATFVSMMNMKWWENSSLPQAGFFISGLSAINDIVVWQDYLYFVGSESSRGLEAATVGRFALGDDGRLSSGLVDTKESFYSSGSSSFSDLCVGTRIYTAGSTTASDFITTSTYLSDGFKYALIVLAISTEESNFCVPVFPAYPESTTEIFLYYNENSSEPVIYWPVVKFEWSEAYMGKPCNSCVNYTVQISNHNGITNISAGTNLTTTYTFPLEETSYWSWHVKACDSSTCTSSLESSVSLTIEPHKWSTDLADEGWASSWSGGQISFPSNDGTDTTFLRFTATEETDSFEINFSTDHYLLDVGTTWISLKIRALNCNNFKEGPILFLRDYNNNYTLWNASSSFIPLGGEWYTICFPMDRSVITVFNWEMDSSDEYQSAWTVKLTLSGFLNDTEGDFMVEIDDFFPVAHCVPYLGNSSEDSEEGLSKNSSEGIDWKMLVEICVPVGGVTAIIIVVGSVTITALACRRFNKNKENSKKPEQVWTTGVELNPIDTFNDTNSILVEHSAFPISFDDFTLAFQYSTRQAPVGESIKQDLTLTNNSDSKFTIKFFPPESAKVSFNFDPVTVLLKPGEEMVVTATALITCTTRLDMYLIAAVSPHSTWKDPIKHTKIPVVLESKLSAKLDPDEFVVFTPAIGEGSFGSVYKGEWRGQQVAIKVLKNQSFNDASVKAEFEHEVGVMESFRSPYIVHFVGACHIPGKLAILTEFIANGSLRSCYLKNTLSLPFKVKCLLDVARGMDYLHRSAILHRDLKPDNVLMSAVDLTSPVACKLIDFGTTRDINVSQATQFYTRGVGTPVYMAPEILDNGKYSQSADVFSFAVTFWSLLTGLDPYVESRFSTSWKIADFIIKGNRLAIPADAPADLSALLSKCWAVEPHERPKFSAIVVQLETKWVDLMQDKRLRKQNPLTRKKVEQPQLAPVPDTEPAPLPEEGGVAMENLIKKNPNDGNDTPQNNHQDGRSTPDVDLGNPPEPKKPGKKHTHHHHRRHHRHKVADSDSSSGSAGNSSDDDYDK
ncbi:protein serine/threonine kinase [Pelomyxa schiedti]|nr:protein serine/threonine kinase [Pelomyxa schiedti]